MNMVKAEAITLTQGVANYALSATLPEALKIVVSPVYPYLDLVNNHIPSVNDCHLYLSAQDCSAHEKGAHTGEVSPIMLKDIGCHFVILGHSERRAQHQESADLLAQKVRLALDSGLQIIFCCGEQLEERKAGNQNEVVINQIKGSLGELSADDWTNIVIAYEPVWAIGTGETASPEQANDMHKAIRSFVAGHLDQTAADQLSILYGGSVKPANAADLFACSDIDGALIGGASLKTDSFTAITQAMIEQIANV